MAADDEENQSRMQSSIFDQQSTVYREKKKRKAFVDMANVSCKTSSDWLGEIIVCACFMMQ